MDIEVDIEKEIMEVLAAELSKEIDDHILQTLREPALTALKELMIDLERIMQGFVKNKKFPLKLSFKQQLGGDRPDWLSEYKTLWYQRLPRFSSCSEWSYHFTENKTDVVFTFSCEEDRVAFLLLMS